MSSEQGLLGNDFSITNALLVILALLGLYLLSQGLSRRWRSFDRWINGLPLVLVEDGRLIDDRARKAGFLEDDILEQARANQGIERMEQIKYAVLERDGSISVILKVGSIGLIAAIQLVFENKGSWPLDKQRQLASPSRLLQSQ